MPELSLYNIEQISSDIRNQEITFSHLLDDLIDHVCCDVENEMQKGLTFTEAYQMVKQKMGSRRRLKEVQEETLYAVDIKYRQMKNTMKISGVAGTIMLGFATLFKIMHWHGAGIMMTLGALTLSFIFLPSALGVLWKETHNARRLFLFISGFFAGMFFIMGILFKVQHWPGAGPLLSLAALSGILLFIPGLLVVELRDQENKNKRPSYILGATGLIFYFSGQLFKIQHWPLAQLLMVAGLIILFVIAFPWYTVITWKEENHIKPKFIFLVVGSLAIVIPSAMLTLNLQRSYDKGYYLNHDQGKALYNYMHSSNKSFLDIYRDSSAYFVMKELNSRTTDLIKIINTVEFKMIAESEGKSARAGEDPHPIIKTENGHEIILEWLSKPFHPSPVKDFLLPGTSSRSELEKAMAGYRSYLSGIIPVSCYQTMDQMLDPSIYLPSMVPDGREISLLSGLHALAQMKNGLLAVESCSLKNIVKN